MIASYLATIGMGVAIIFTLHPKKEETTTKSPRAWISMIIRIKWRMLIISPKRKQHTDMREKRDRGCGYEGIKNKMKLKMRIWFFFSSCD